MAATPNGQYLFATRFTFRLESRKFLLSSLSHKFYQFGISMANKIKKWIGLTILFAHKKHRKKRARDHRSRHELLHFIA